MKSLLFKKPDYRSDSEESLKRLEELRKTAKPEQYLQQLYAKIGELENTVRVAETNAVEDMRAIGNIAESRKLEISREIETLNSELLRKREERAELEKPLTERQKRLEEKEASLSKKEESLDTREQNLIRRELDVESKLEGVRDLADELGDKRSKLAIETRLLESRKASQTEREARYMAAQSDFKEYEAKIRNDLQAKEFAIGIRELSVQGKEEVLQKRSEELDNFHSWLLAQRDLLRRAWNSVNKRKGLPHG